jgi:hypothetical protein
LAFNDDLNYGKMGPRQMRKLRHLSLLREL